jgi:hypothetical protein
VARRPPFILPQPAEAVDHPRFTPWGIIAITASLPGLDHPATDGPPLDDVMVAELAEDLGAEQFEPRRFAGGCLV